MTKYKWGFLRETTALAKKAGIDKATGLHRTGLEEYLKVFFLRQMIGYTTKQLAT